MIELVTGLPGSSKTLITIQRVKDRSEKENRPVFYKAKQSDDDWGLVLTDEGQRVLGWHKLDDPEKWYECPEGSIILLDECQKLFRPRGNGSAVPAYESHLETHRHKGHDLVLITQHPMLVSTNVRRLAGRHIHTVRTFGLERATLHEWSEVKVEPDKSREGSVRREWNYPKHVYKWYVSAEVHTHKRSIPPRVYFLLSLPLFLAALIYGTYKALFSGEADPQTVAAAEQPLQLNGSAPAAHVMTTLEYVQSYRPRLDDLPHSAPRYDELTKPVVAPKPSSCIQSASRGCRCYSQQATPLNVPDNTCRQIVRDGWFDDTLSVDRKDLSSPPVQSSPPVREGGGVSLS